MGHAHIVIVHHHGQHIDRRAVRAQQDHIVKLIVADGHIPLHLIADHGGAFQRRLDADHVGRVGVACRISVAPGRAVERAASLGACGLAEGGDLFLGSETFIGFTRCEQLIRHFGVAGGVFELADDFAVVI